MNWERFFLQKHKNIYVLHYCFHFWYSSNIFNANPRNRNFHKFLFREKSRFLHRNCFYTSLYRIFMNIPGTYPLVKFCGGSENRIGFCVKILWEKIQLPKHRKNDQNQWFPRITLTLEHSYNLPQNFHGKTTGWFVNFRTFPMRCTFSNLQENYFFWHKKFLRRFELSL